MQCLNRWVLGFWFNFYHLVTEIVGTPSHKNVTENVANWLCFCQYEDVIEDVASSFPSEAQAVCTTQAVRWSSLLAIFPTCHVRPGYVSFVGRFGGTLSQNERAGFHGYHSDRSLWNTSSNSPSWRDGEANFWFWQKAEWTLAGWGGHGSALWFWNASLPVYWGAFCGAAKTPTLRVVKHARQIKTNLLVAML